MNSPYTETLWHVTVLSNFARAYDKYTRNYSKELIPESTFPNRFFLLRENELDIGVQKASRLQAKLGLSGNKLIALRTQVSANQLNPNLRTGLGRFVNSSTIRIDEVAFVEGIVANIQLVPAPIEEVIALSFRLLSPQLHDYPEIMPRSLSVLPIARGCQASCPFCFSEASASADQEQDKLDLVNLRRFAISAKSRGAERFVITGGGEPGLLRHDRIKDVINLGFNTLGKTVLITNGHHLAGREPVALESMLADYADHGLAVLALSRHHYDEDVCERLMTLRTNVTAIAKAWEMGSAKWPNLRLRFTCVLQKGCVDNIEEMAAYVDWASSLGVTEICFKELYVSTSVESVYHRHAANEWSYANQVPLSLVLEFASRHSFEEIARLPWGAPVFRGLWKGRVMQIAAYTEPTLFWERANGIARSWNVMSDGRCLASLEDRESEVLIS